MEVKNTLLEIRDKLRSDALKFSLAADAIDKILISDENTICIKKTALGMGRRKDLISQLRLTVKKIGSGTIHAISKQLRDDYPVFGEIQLESKVCTYLKRMTENGELSVDGNHRGKIYTHIK